MISALLIHVADLLPAGGLATGRVRPWCSSIVLNLILAVFNMIPLPPLDGGRVAVGLLPRALALPAGAGRALSACSILLVLLIGLPDAGPGRWQWISIYLPRLLLPPIEFSL